MPSLHLHVSDSALRAALLEQMRHLSGWQLSEGAASHHPTDFAILDSDGITADGVEKFLVNNPSALTFVLKSAPTHAVTGKVEVIQKPFRLGYLLARLNFHDRLQSHQSTTDYLIGPYRFFPRERKAIFLATDTTIPLSDKESELLTFLCQTTTKLHRQDLLHSVWGYDSNLDTHTLETHIYLLRRKLPLADDMDLFLVDQGHYQLNPALRSA